MVEKQYVSMAWLIDSTAREIRAVEYSSLAEMNTLLGGSIEMAYSWPNGDTLYVDAEGLFKDGSAGYFHISVRPDQPLAGNGLLVGEEHGDAMLTTAPPTITLAQLQRMVHFI